MHGFWGRTSASVKVEGLVLLIRIQNLMHISAKNSNKRKVIQLPMNSFTTIHLRKMWMMVGSLKVQMFPVSFRITESQQLMQHPFTRSQNQGTAMQIKWHWWKLKKIQTCVRRRFLFEESGVLSVQKLFLFCPPAPFQFYCCQTSLRKDTIMWINLLKLTWNYTLKLILILPISLS